MKRADPKLIGAFVLGAIVLAVVGLVFFGKGGLFTQRQRYVLYFDRSVKGLSVGAPVNFRGVRIGSVADISVHVQPADFTFKIPVVIEVDSNRIEAIDSNGEVAPQGLSRFGGEDTLSRLIAKGLRGQLQLQSLITGQLFVQLDMYPQTKVVLSHYRNLYPEIPTIPSGLEELSRTFENLPIQEIADKLTSTLDGLQELVHNPDLADSLFKLNHGLDELRELVARGNAGFGPALQDFRSASTAVRHSADSVAKQVAGMAERSQQTLGKLDGTLDRATSTLSEAQAMLKKNSALGAELRRTLVELRRAARALRILSETLEEHPDMLLRGRGLEEKP
ncbi:MlaD family protein [Geothermobacter hydrogeniphilus]|uniref:Mce/MlaD domain-containing protein n=1 Tax=Geothermobacter hydrogeniphilus TaxID=1969733 RepID=A0A1X0Y668_9BACT|nr:MlaD family protein [Geothermobacter hydrogeniphilus]ORJ60623.1 hypothetical protein B5V00_07245 [Geothermobacter hydrogeniphilus]